MDEKWWVCLGHSIVGRGVVSQKPEPELGIGMFKEKKTSIISKLKQLKCVD
jgi:hypothetical protein